jgi:apolipoprotein N-acyltransferase
VYGQAALRAAPAAERGGGVPVALVQANLSLDSRWRSSFYGINLERQVELSREVARQGESRILFWPESSFTFFLEEEPAYRRYLASFLTRADLELVAGGPSRAAAEPQDRSYFNSIFVLDDAGAIRGRYDKHHLVPFAEYLPLRRLDFLRRRFERVRVFQHGERAAPLPTRAGPAGILVCNEAMYPEVARERVRQGARYLVNPSNDTWIQDEVWAERMFDLVSLRAVEQRRYLVRASSSGPSAIVDPWGRVQQRTPPFQQATVLGHIEPRDELSVYARLGDVFAWACVAVVAGALTWQRVGRGA